ncbi:MAG: TetR/AcrR family transcriptional regulator [Bacteroidota bacterium]|nr:TetR/AcrR family transcriptional regulator [Bacteroidota bacterium]
MRTKEGNKAKTIIDAAIEVFAADGFHNAKISQIAQIAGIATGSIYLYYPNKESILSKIFEQVWSSLALPADDLLARKDMNPIEKLENLIDLFFDIFTEDPNLAKVFVNDQEHLMKTNSSAFIHNYENFLDTGEKIVLEGIKSQCFNPNIDIKIFRNFFFGGIRHLLHLWARDHKAFPLNVVRQNVKFILKKGILE